MAAVLTALGLLVLLGAGGATRAAADSGVRVPKLPDGPGSSTNTVIDEPARAVPAITTVCWDPPATRCWTVAGESACTVPTAPAARPFRVVIGGPSDGDAEHALRECRAQPGQ